MFLGDFAVINIFQRITTPGQFWLAAALSTVFFVAVMTLLHRLSPPAKKWLSIICTFAAGLFFLIEFLLPVGPLPDGKTGNIITPWVEPVSNFVLDVMMWMLLLGIISLVGVHARRLVKQQAGWHNSLAFFLAFIAIIAVGLPTQMGNTGTDVAKLVYDSLFRGLLINLDSTMFALLAFYIASAAYRAFRVRTLEAGLLMVAALIVMLGFVNFGVAMTSWIGPESPFAYFRMENMSMWLMNWVNMPSQRAVLVGVAIGSLAMAMRLWLSLERGAFFSQE